jgi:hypothetical protein
MESQVTERRIVNLPVGVGACMIGEGACREGDLVCRCCVEACEGAEDAARFGS